MFLPNYASYNCSKLETGTLTLDMFKTDENVWKLGKFDFDITSLTLNMTSVKIA